MEGAVITISIVLIVIGGITACLISYFMLLGRRADSEGNREYRRLAEQAIATQDALHAQLVELTNRMSAVEQLLRSIDEN